MFTGTYVTQTPPKLKKEIWLGEGHHLPHPTLNPDFENLESTLQMAAVAIGLFRLLCIIPGEFPEHRLPWQ